MAILDIEYGREILDQANPDSKQKEIQEMEMVLQNSSYGHEYAMMELQETQCLLEKEALNFKLEEYKRAYFDAREFLSANHPRRLEILEQELVEQKVLVFKAFNA